MALCATAPAFAATDNSQNVTASFYAYYDSDKDGDKEWAPAPMGMATGCIDSCTSNDGVVTLNFKGFSVYGMTGYITNITGDDVLDVRYTKVTNEDGSTTTQVAAAADLGDAGMATVPGTNVQGIPANLYYSILGTGMTQNMAVYAVIQ